MSAVTIPAERVQAVDPDGPAHAHITSGHKRTVGLCGARLIGCDPPSTWPVCKRCLEIAGDLAPKEWRRR